MKYVLAIDQSTSATKAILFDQEKRLVARCDMPHKQIVNARGWIEHDPEEILRNTYAVSKAVVEKASIDSDDVACIGISNQRETAVAWNRHTGKSVCNAVVWQCGRATEITERSGLRENARQIYERTGLQLSPFFSGPKYAWILENIQGARELHQKNMLLFGTIDSWLLYHISADQVHKTDYSNASRTMLLNLDTLDWDTEIMDWLGIRRDALPTLCESDAVFCHTDMGGLFPKHIPVCGVMGDSQAALFANGCVKPHMAKATFGTGTSVMLNIGEARMRPSHSIVESIGWRMGGKTCYVLEGNINYTGALIKWLVENAQMLSASKEAGTVASTVPDTAGVYFVPAFGGLGAPYWINNAGALLCGMHIATTKAHIVRAAEEAIAYQIKDIFAEFRALDCVPLDFIYADGGAKNDAMLMQFIADILDVRVCTTEIEELSAAGAGIMAMLKLGIMDRERAFVREDAREYIPDMSSARRDELYLGWKRAVKMLITTKEEKD